jgi:hypothetical protein
LEKREEPVLLGSKQGQLGEGEGGEQWGEMTQTMCTYEYMNKEKNFPSLQTLLLPMLYLWT